MVVVVMLNNVTVGVGLLLMMMLIIGDNLKVELKEKFELLSFKNFILNELLEYKI